jgi:beta-fructofuranosidase
MKRTSLLILTILLSACQTSTSQSSGEYRFLNSGFEYGDLTGWEVVSGTAFDDVSVQVADSNAKRNRIVDTFFLNSGTHGSSQIGRINSQTFVVEGNGKIGVLLGGARDTTLTYVGLFSALTDVELGRVSNTHFATQVPNSRLYRHILDASNYLGQEVYLSIIDQDDSSLDYSYLLVDDIIVSFEGTSDVGTFIEDARDYTNTYKDSVVDTYRHRYHLMPTIGWMNDPNGLVYHDGQYHLFYQHNPYSPQWDTMHWGHAVSDDLIKWEDVGVALAPDTLIDRNGVYSGGAITGKDGSLNLLYTTVGDNGVQQQGLATSFDGLNFTKRSMNPVIDSSMRMGSRLTDFRDPYVYRVGDMYYALIGGKLEGPGGQLLLYKSSDLRTWQSVGVTYASSLTGTGMFECPNVITIDGKDIILSSPQAIRDEDSARYQNLHSVTYQVGRIDYQSGVFTNDVSADTMEELDKGFDFYATQTLSHLDQNIMLAWMNMWSRSYPTAVDGWTGSVTLPRTMDLVDGHIYQQPIPAITNYYKNEQSINTLTLTNSSQMLDFSGKTLQFKAEIDVSQLGQGQVGFEVFKGTNQATKIYYDNATNHVVFDRRNSGIRIESFDDDGELNVRYAKVMPKANQTITLEIFLDVSSVEVFINDGYYTMTGVVYPDQSSDQIAFYTSNGTATLNALIKHDIEV